MTKNLKLNIKNPQIAEAINLKGLKAKLAKQKEDVETSSEALPSADEKAPKAKKKPASKTATSTTTAPTSKVEAKSEVKTSDAQTDAADEHTEKKKRARTKAKEEPTESEAAILPKFTSQAAAQVSQPSVHVEKKEVEIKTKKVEETRPSVESEQKTQGSQVAAAQNMPQSVPQSAPQPPIKPSVSATQTPSQYAPRPGLPQSRPPYSPSTQPSSQYSQPSQQRGQPYREPFPRRQESTGQTQYGSPSQRSAPFKAKPFESKPFEAKPFETKPVDARSSDARSVGARPVDTRPVDTRPPQERRPDSYERRGDSYGNDRAPPRSHGAPYPSSRPPGSAPYPSSRPPYQGQGRPQGQYSQGSRPPGGPYPSSRPPYQGQRPQGSYPPGQHSQGPGQYGPRQEGSRPEGSRPEGRYPPRREGGFAGPREFGRDTLARHLPPTMKEGLPARTPDDVKKPRSGFGEAPTKYKGKVKDVAPQKPGKRVETKAFDTRARHGIVSDEEDGGAWRARRRAKAIQHHTAEIVRPTKIKIRLPITIKELAVEMKLKASELISKLFIQGLKVTLNDLLDDPTVVELLGHEFGCEIGIDTAEEERIRISDKNVREEIAQQDTAQLILRPPIVAFMGHVDHGKTSLIDAIRKSNRAAKEVGAITQHIGAFKCTTPQGNLTILDTPGHEAFTLMRERGAGITDIVVLVIAGDEGIQEQTVEALKQAKSANATIVVALTKSDKPSFDADRVFRQLADRDLLPEAWGGQTIVIQCSAVTGKGIQELLEMLALQAEVLELKANPSQRARGTVIESEMQQGLGSVATILVQNGTLKTGDALVFGEKWARVKNMRDENGIELAEAPPSTPVQITGLSGLPEAGEEFIVVKNEKEAREIANVRQEGKRQSGFQLKKRVSLESMMENAKQLPKKVFTIILRADVQGSLEALVKALEKIQSDKVELNIISQGVGQISESDVQLGATSKACIIGFHTAVETHAESLIKEMGVKVLLHNIIYHVVDAVKLEMKSLLDKLPLEVEKGKAEVKAVFKASQLGSIAGCQVIEGTITRNCLMRVKRGKDVIWKGTMTSLKRVKEDVKEVQKGVECGILLSNYNDEQIGDILEAYEVTYITQDL